MSALRRYSQSDSGANLQMRRLIPKRPQMPRITLPSRPSWITAPSHDAMEIIGLGAVFVGIALIHIPSALIVAGMGVVVFNLLAQPPTGDEG